MKEPTIFHLGGQPYRLIDSATVAWNDAKAPLDYIAAYAVPLKAEGKG